jgi:hypothetical protein
VWLGWPSRGPSRRRETISLLLRLLIAVLLIVASPQVTWVGFGRELLQKAVNLTAWVTLHANQLLG